MGQDNQNRLAPNVVTTQHFHQLLRSGYRAEVLCEEPAFKKSAVWYGLWFVRVISADGRDEKLITSTRFPGSAKEELRIRRFKTANGLISFLAAAGFTHPVVPLVAGGRQVLELPDEPYQSADDDSDD